MPVRSTRPVQAAAPTRRAPAKVPPARAGAAKAPAEVDRAESAESQPADTQRWRLLVAYDGRGFRGFAAQPGAATVAGALSGALTRVTRASEALVITCAGRTDAGVHAAGQVVHVDLPAPLPTIRRGGTTRTMAGADLIAAVNRQLAPAVVVRAAEPAPDGFDARRSATARRYRYLVWNAPAPDPLLAGVAWHVEHPLDLRAMAAATDALVGEHDFGAFCRRPPGSAAGSPIVRRVTRAGWTLVPVADEFEPWPRGADRPPGRLLRFEIEAGSFCHQMVRSIVALLVEVGRGEGNVASTVARLRSADRAGAPRPAPPEGLCLVAVAYGP
ncbi:MAG TPA: tRNA pseudouridine(38-40) synthase TruA [Acidimicrobiales bacterium]|nr:tRNA pseudouridine(38-40) synthase TruA [Acidimicrobiales bacterium]